ncbi:hypothetical protein VUR80DRAFT_9029 [Thermomyces stellatus]
MPYNIASQGSPGLAHRGHPRPALSQRQELHTEAMACKPQDSNSYEQPSGPCSESHFCPIEAAGTRSQDTQLRNATVFPSPTPSGEAPSPPPRVASQPGLAGSEAPATEAARVVPGVAGPATEAPTDSLTRPTVPVEARPATGTAKTRDASAAQQAATSQARCKHWIAQLMSYISHRDGSLQPSEKGRLESLKTVLSMGDELCVVVHGFVSLWVLDPDRCAELLKLPRAVVDPACGTLDIVFGWVRTLRNDLLVFLVNFPPGLRNGDLHSASVVDASRVFQRLASSWNGILHDHLKKRQVPLRHRELVGVLQLRPQALRQTFFQWSLRFLGVHIIADNATVIKILEDKFAEDQDFYLDQSRSKEEYEIHDEKIAAAFEVLLSVTK